ncbi:uncharacterized protein LOC115874172 [Sitophilus oryzae]|uniref:Uncharacterized protein LOC115874172 n=1 Tax=Sitophilus oryzae TaxID=7048 RepID=A0A6J2X1P0_SITOR|nr:uncharacterized protein LOC115874172 [Sitophilus oryzae]
MSLFTDMIEHIRHLLKLAANNNKEALLEGLTECRKAVRKIGIKMKKAKTQGKKQHLETCLKDVKSLRRQLKACQKKGQGIKSTKEAPSRRVKWDDVNSAFKSRVRTGVVTNIKHIDPTKFLEDCALVFKRKIQKILKPEFSLKINTVFCGEFQVAKADQIQSEFKYLNTKNAPVYQDTDFDIWFKEHVTDPLLVKLSDFQENASGWALSRVINLSVNINKYNPLHAGSYIDLPKSIKSKKACVNIQNSDDMCFAWAVTSALYPPLSSKVADRTSSYPNPKDVLNLEGIQFPMTQKQVPRFERQNDVSVNIYRLKQQTQKKKQATEKTTGSINKTKKNLKVKSSSEEINFKVYPAFLTKNKLEKHVNVLVIQDHYVDEDDEDDYIDRYILPVKTHFVWIKNLSRLISKQINNHNGKKWLCDRCLHYLYSEEKLNVHLKDCVKLNTGGGVPTTPEKEGKNNRIGFKNVKSKEKSPFVIYADTECFLRPAENNRIYQHHEPYSIGYYVKCSYDDTLSFYKSHTGQDCMKWFVKELEDNAKIISTALKIFLPMDLTSEQRNNFNKATHCHVCEKPFDEKNIKVRDHCHLTGKYRGPAHKKCNLNYKDSQTVPVLFHNLSSYDGHMVVKALAETKGNISVLPVNKEKYISFTKKIPGYFIEFRFIDSFRFLAAGLSDLASYLTEYPILRSEYRKVSGEQFSLLCRKGIFPYDFMDDWPKLDYAKLPEKQSFYNSLTESYIKDTDYAHAQTVWNSFECKTMRDYSELYMKTDILLLADVFETFRTTAHKEYGLCPVHSYTLPGYAWQVMLFQMSKTNLRPLELLTDLDMVLFIEKGIRGGLSQCSQRYAEANNKYMDNYDSSKEDSYLMYFDINNQYGWAMSQFLPYGGFEWLDQKKLQKLKTSILEIADDARTGYILEVDLEIPNELHDKFSDLPPCPEHDKPPGSKNAKLLATLHKKEQYVIHYRNLKQAIHLGVKVTNIQRGISFHQSPWLKRYIDQNTVLRQKAKNDFEKNLFKLMNNAVFGKTMENIRNHSSLKLVTKWEGRYGAEALISNPEFKNITIINENFIIIEMAKSVIYFNKPIYVGMSILDIAKTTTYKFHYDYMLKNFSNNCTVIYTDTDSLIYEIKNLDVYDMIKRDCYQHFDTSDYATDNIYGIPKVNKKVLGMMKDENNGRIMTHFVGLRSKMYATKLFYTSEELEQQKLKLEEDGIERKEIEMHLKNKGITKKIKGVKKYVIKNKVTFEDYVECLEKFVEKSISQNLIRSKNHELYTIKQTKIGLSPHDDKRSISETSIKTLPWGHYSIIDT